MADRARRVSGGGRPLRLSTLESPSSFHSPSSTDSDQGRNSFKIEPLDHMPAKKKKRKFRSKPEDSDNVYLDSVPKLQQQSYDPAEDAKSNNNILRCIICGIEYQLTMARYFEAHMAQHTCPICKTAMPFKDIVKHVKLHLVNKSTRDNQLDIPCQFCAKRFKTLTKFESHMSLIHRCPVCEQCFGKKRVIDHIKTHFNADGTVKVDEKAGGSNNKGGDESVIQPDGSSDTWTSIVKQEESNHTAKVGNRLLVKIKKGKYKRTVDEVEEEDEEEDDTDEESEEDVDDVEDNEDKDDGDDDGGGGDDASSGNSGKKENVEGGKPDRSIRSPSEAADDKGGHNNNDKIVEKTHDGDNDVIEVNDDDDDHDVVELSDDDDDDVVELIDDADVKLEDIVNIAEESEISDSERNMEGMEEDNDDNENGEEGRKDKGLVKKNYKSRAEYIREIKDRVSKVTSEVDGQNVCQICHFACRFPNRIAKHVRKAHYCEFCDEFFSKQDLPNHLRSHDKVGESHVCQFCRDEFLSAVKLHYHDCSYNRKASLYYHCKMCDHRSTNRDALSIHVRTHDPADFQAEYDNTTCQLCGFIFLGRPNLKRHMASRPCAHCGLQTVSSCQHQKHVLSCHNSKAFHCHKCQVQFLSQHSYVDHVTERECSGCNEMFEPACEYLKHESLCKTGREREQDVPEFSCLKCGTILNDTYVYDNHVRDHSMHPSKNLCKHCMQQFSQNKDYGMHMSKRTCPQCLTKFQPICKWSQHTCPRIDPPTVSCPTCKLVFNKASSYRKHCKVVRCHSCPDLTFNSICEINKHYEQEHGGIFKREDVEDVCAKRDRLKSNSEVVSNSVAVLDNHEQAEDGEHSDDEDEDEEPGWSTSKDGTIKSLATGAGGIAGGAAGYQRYQAKKSCEYCPEYRMPMSYSKLRRHMLGANCQICKQLVTPFCRMNEHYVQCAYNLAPTEENRLSLLDNDGSRPVHCPLCRMKLNTVSGLKSHLRIQETACKECGEKFMSPCVYRLHQRQTQHGQRDCVCPICSKGFQYSRDLKKHLLIHTGERPYDCLLCGNSYRNPGHLSYHLKVQHGGARPYKCKYCGRGFGAQSGCNKHEKRHERTSEHKCEHCGMMFVAAHSLTKHRASQVCILADTEGGTAANRPHSMRGRLPNMMEEAAAADTDIDTAAAADTAADADITADAVSIKQEPESATQGEDNEEEEEEDVTIYDLEEPVGKNNNIVKSSYSIISKEKTKARKRRKPRETNHKVKSPRVLLDKLLDGQMNEEDNNGQTLQEVEEEDLVKECIKQEILSD